MNILVRQRERFHALQICFKFAPVCEFIANIVIHSHQCKYQGKGVANMYSCKDEFAMAANSID